MPLRLLACALAALTASCVGGPDSCFLPPSIVDTARVLALRADPPDQVVDLAGSAGPRVQVRALFGGHANTQPLRLGGRLCAPTEDLRCPEGSLQLPPGPLHEPFDFEADVAFTVPLDLIRAAREADPLKGLGGIRVLFDAEAEADARTFHAGKLLLFQTLESGVRPNGGLELEAVELSNPDQGLLLLGTPAAPELLVGQTYGVRPRIRAGAGASEAAEQYEVTDLSGRKVTLRETVSYSFFTTRQLIFGDLRSVAGNPVPLYVVGADLADEPPFGSPETANGLLRLTVLLRATTSLWVVARDGRGAVAWLRGSVSALDERGTPAAYLGVICDESSR
jgi:hypothetical protein